MGKKKIIILIVFTIVFTLAIVISAGVGYLAAYVRGLQQIYDMETMAYCHVLLLGSRRLNYNIDCSGVNGLIDAVEQNGDSLVALVRPWDPPIRGDDKKRISKAHEEWEMAKKKLEELRSSYETYKDPNSVG